MDEAGAGWQVFTWVWDRKDEIGKKLADVYAWFKGGDTRKPKPGILILGSGGAGKTTLGKLLAGEFDFLVDEPGAYNESIGIESYTLKDAPNVEIVVPPGQQHRRDATWSDLHADLAAGKFRGVMLLNSYGYQTLGQISYKDHALYKGNKDEFMKAYLEDRRADELSIFRQLVPHIKASRQRLWLLTLVTKQDLWWPKRSEVEQHYRQGEYGAAVATLLSGQDQRRLTHEMLFASLVICNFATGRDERLKSNAGGYDHRLQVESLRRLFEVVDALKNWESEP
jgi:hypothetical protein